ncbi:MAG TPA: hypothetical protein VEW08_15660 [Steroidobacteraceae bacterium]|nr:hypothetical protein [Steroidobacteraceae bacterium]
MRATYLATAVCASVLALPFAVSMLAKVLTGSSNGWNAALSFVLALFLFVLPAARAFRRLFGTGTVIPPELVHERPVVAWVVTLAGGFGHFFFVISVSAAFEIALEPERGEDVGGPLAGAFILTLLLYLIALLCAELALVGDGKSDASRGLRSGPFS